MTKNLVLCGLGNDDCPFFFAILALLQSMDHIRKIRFAGLVVFFFSKHFTIELDF